MPGAIASVVDTIKNGLGRNLPDPGGVLRPGKLLWLRGLGWMVAMLAVLVVILSLQSVVRTITQDSTVIVAMAFVTVVLAYGAYAGLVRWGERRVPGELAPRPLARELVAGVLVGMGIMAVTIGILAAMGVYAITPGDWTDPGHDIREALGTGLLEELLARLVIFRILARAFRTDVALLISALLFGLAHIFNPGATWLSASAIAIEAGLTLAGFYLLTGRIWMAVGVHAGWNFAQGALFGAPVSGMASVGSLLVTRAVPGAPDWLSGGAFGPEATPVAVVVGLAVFLATLRAMAVAAARTGAA